MSGEHTRVRVAAPLRCPACHEELRAEEPILRCSQEHAAIHEACVELTPRCPALGCDEALTPPEPAKPAVSVAPRAPTWDPEATEMHPDERRWLAWHGCVIAELEAQPRRGWLALWGGLSLVLIIATIAANLALGRGEAWAGLALIGLVGASIAALKRLVSELQGRPQAEAARPWIGRVGGPERAREARRRWRIEREACLASGPEALAERLAEVAAWRREQGVDLP